MLHSFALGVSILSLWCTLPLAFLFPIGWCPLTPSVSPTLVRRSPISWTSPSSVSVPPIGFPYLWVFPFPLLSLSCECFNPIPLPLVWFPITFAFISLRCYFYCSWLFQQYTLNCYLVSIIIYFYMVHLQNISRRNVPTTKFPET